MGKTIKEWLSELPSPIREKALFNFEKEGLWNDDDTKVESLSAAIISGFTWNESEEPSDYWGSVYLQAKSGSLKIKQKSATELIETALWNGDELSGLDILNRWKVYRASSVINKLRAKGVPIETRIEQHPATGKRYGVYFIDVLDRAMREEKTEKIVL